MDKLTIAGVPEHFNAPLKVLAEQHPEFSFVEVPEGTGAMLSVLLAHEVDVIVALTEGLVKAQAKGHPIHIIAPYVTTPLTWGVHCLANSPNLASGSAIETLNDLKHKTFAISRPGSGSELMAEVLAQQQGWQKQDINFITAGNIHRIIDTLKQHKAQAFLWEVFTTKPYLQKHNLAKIAEIPTPWPCFQLAIHQDLQPAKKQTLQMMLEALFQITQQFNQDLAYAAQQVQRYYPMAEQDLQQWLATVNWATQPEKLRDDIRQHIHRLVLQGDNEKIR